jgi:hypothetical protein
MYLSGSDRFDRPLTQGQKTEILDHLVRFAACLRQHGVDAPDPKADAQGDPSLVLPDSYSIDDPDPKIDGEWVGGSTRRSAAEPGPGWVCGVGQAAGWRVTL